MPRGQKTKYTSKQKRMAQKIEKGYSKRGKSKKESERRAWATVNKMTGGGKKRGGSGVKKKLNTSPAKKGERSGGKATGSRTAPAKRGGARKTARSRGGRK